MVKSLSEYQIVLVESLIPIIIIIIIIILKSLNLCLIIDLAVLLELTRHFHPVHSPSCVAEDSRSGNQFQVGVDRGDPCLQLASRSSVPRTRRCGKKKFLDQLTFGTSCGMTKPAGPSLHEQCRYACKAEAATQFHGWHTVSAPYA